ncbi:MAG: SLBB domain-containing protein [Caulobacter sp.]|nr:SLBB domain-containing protein [Vitreoscilla sp.]
MNVPRRSTPISDRASRVRGINALARAFALTVLCTLAFATGAQGQPAQSEEGLRLAPSTDLSSRGMQDYISTGAAPISIRSQSLPAQQSIRIDAGQRVEMQGAPDASIRTGPGVASGQQGVAEDPANSRSRTEFQQLIYKTRGKDIEHFGLAMFGPPPTSFSLVDRIAPPANYPIAAGDEIRVRAWGQVDMDFMATVERNGALYIPLIGAVQVAGVPFSELRALLRNRIARNYKNFELDVTLGGFHAMQVYVTGRAAKPGAYTLSGLTSLINAVFAVGGPGESGSLRRVAVRRANVVIAEVDLYDFLLRGDKSKDVRLQSGDVIYFPPVAGYAAITGSVPNPAIFEVLPKSTLAELIDLAGGLSTTAAAGRVIVERIENRQARVVAEFNTGAEGAARQIRDGDVVQIDPISPRFENEVTLRGHVPQTNRLPWRAGMRVTDLVPDQMALLAHQYWQVRNEKARGSHWLLDPPARGARIAGNQPPPLADPTRLARPAAGSQRATEGNGNFPARDSGDRLRVQPVQGLSPTARPLSDNADNFSGDEPFGRTPSPSPLASLTPRPDMLDELDRGNQDVYWEYATIERFDSATLKTTLIPFDLSKAIVQKDAAENRLLQPGDVVTVFSQRDIRVPVDRQTQYVRIEGEVARPGIYQIRFAQTLASVVAQAGGLTPNAYVFGTELVREETRQLQQQELDNLVDRLGESLERSAATRLRESLDGGGAGPPDASAALLDAQRRLVRKLRLVRASGRILLDGDAIGEPGSARVEKLDVVMQDGDRVYVPAKPSTVLVMGSVNRPNAMIWRPGRAVTDYVGQAGGATREAARDVLVARANGSVQRVGGGFFDGGTAVLPGESILVMESTDHISNRRLLRDWTQIIYQGALGVAGLRLLSDVFSK